jgi:hypothetical protein
MTDHTHSILIDRLGGTVAVAKAAGARAGEPLRPQSVTQWRKRGIAHPWRPTIAAMAQDANIEVPADFLRPPARNREAAVA